MMVKPKYIVILTGLFCTERSDKHFYSFFSWPIQQEVGAGEGEFWYDYYGFGLESQAQAKIVCSYK